MTLDNMDSRNVELRSVHCTMSPYKTARGDELSIWRTFYHFPEGSYLSTVYVVPRIILIRFLIVLLYICAFFSEFLISFSSINRNPSSGGKVIYSLWDTGRHWFPTFPSLAAQPLKETPHLTSFLIFLHSF